MDAGGGQTRPRQSHIVRPAGTRTVPRRCAVFGGTPAGCITEPSRAKPRVAPSSRTSWGVDVVHTEKSHQARLDAGFGPRRPRRTPG